MIIREIIDRAESKINMQNFFDKNDATKMLLFVLSDPITSSKMSHELFDSFLEFGISLLDGGNPNVQKTIYIYCTNVQHSEIMFRKFHEIISQQIKIIDNENNNKNSGEESKIERANQLTAGIMEKLLRFLQLFTEGHYLELQNYLRFQHNNRNNYDMVGIVIDLLRSYYANMSREYYENIIRCLDTINEFVQGPCSENQLTVVDSKFFEMASGILTREIPEINEKETLSKNDYFKQLSHKHKSKYLHKKELYPWMIVRLKYKVLR